MSYSFGEGGTVLMAGCKYDLGKVIVTAEQIVDALAVILDGREVRLTTDSVEFNKEIPWPAPGKEVARRFWLNASTLYDGVHEPLVILAGPFKLRWYALGRASVLYDGARDMIVGDDSKEIVNIDPEPCLVVYGEPSHDLIGFVSDAISGTCKRLGLGLWLAEPGPTAAQVRIEGHVALIRFPHEKYGDGQGMVRIRCRPISGEAS